MPRSATPNYTATTGRLRYIIAPPSRHRNGGTYRWAPGRAPGEIVVAAAPPWLLERVRGATATAKREDGTAREFLRSTTPGGSLPERIPEGTRHGQLLRLAGALRNRGLREPELLAVLRTTNDLRCVPPQTDGEVARIARDAGRFPVNATQVPPLPETLTVSRGHQIAALKSVAKTMWRQGMGQFEIAAGLAAINALRCAPPLSNDFLIDIVAVTSPD